MNRMINITDFGVELYKDKSGKRINECFYDENLFYLPCAFYEFEAEANRRPFKSKINKYQVMINLKTMKNSFITDQIPNVLRKEVCESKILEKIINAKQQELVVDRYIDIRIPRIYGLKKPKVRISHSKEIYRPIYIIKRNGRVKAYNGYTGKEEKNII